MQFHKYFHVIRYGKPEVDGYLRGHVYVQSKVDGTNAQIYMRDGQIKCGSRTRELTLDNDNGGFYNYVLNSNDNTATAIRDFLAKHQDITVYGEWIGGIRGAKMLGSIRKYNEGGFYGFDVRRDPETANENDNVGYLSPDDDVYKEIQSALGNHWIPFIAYFDNPTEQEIIDCLDNHFNLPDDVLAEGIVIKNYDYRDVYGHHQMAKIVRDEFRENKGHKNKNTVITDIEQSIADEFVTDADMKKMMNKVLIQLDADEFDNRNGKMIGIFLNGIYNDLIQEEIVEILLSKKYRSATINFSILKKAVQEKGRKYIGLI